MLDDLDRQITACLQADGRASWAAIARQCGTSVATVSRRGQRLLDDGSVRAAVVPAALHPGRSAMFLLHISCQPNMQAAVVAELAQSEEVRFLALVSGRYDIVAEVCASYESSLVGQLVTSVQAIDGVQACRTDLILHEYKVAQDWAAQMLAGASDWDGRQEDHDCEPSHLDALDRGIIELMRCDGRAAFRTVAAQVGVDETTVRRRFESARRRGCVRVITLARAAALGFTAELLLEVGVEPQRLREVAVRLTGFSGVRFVAATVNGSSLLCEVIQPDGATLHRFLTETLGGIQGVRSWEASMELLTVRRGYVETPWWRTELYGGKPVAAMWAAEETLA